MPPGIAQIAVNAGVLLGIVVTGAGLFWFLGELIEIYQRWKRRK